MNERIIDRLRKLMAHKESAESIGSLAEAEAFAAKIQQLLIEHKLEAEQVRAADDHDDEVVGEQMYGAEWAAEVGIPRHRRRVWWMEDLAGYVARAHFCELLIAGGTSSVWFVGKRADRAVSAFVYATLVKAAISLCDEAYKLAVTERRDVRMFRRSFFDGFTAAISQRLREQRKAADVSSESTALVLSRSDEAVEKFIADKFKGKKSRLADIGLNGRGWNQDAYNSGKAAAGSVSITRDVGGNTARRGISDGR